MNANQLKARFTELTGKPAIARNVYINRDLCIAIANSKGYTYKGMVVPINLSASHNLFWLIVVDYLESIKRENRIKNTDKALVTTNIKPKLSKKAKLELCIKRGRINKSHYNQSEQGNYSGKHCFGVTDKRKNGKDSLDKNANISLELSRRSNVIRTNKNRFNYQLQIKPYMTDAYDIIVTIHNGSSINIGYLKDITNSKGRSTRLDKDNLRYDLKLDYIIITANQLNIDRLKREIKKIYTAIVVTRK